MKIQIIATICAAGLLSACVEVADQPPIVLSPAVQPAGDGSDLAGFVGAKAGQAENGLRVRGYNLVRTEGLTAFWYNPSNRTCARIVTSQGKYSSVTAVPLTNCDT